MPMSEISMCEANFDKLQYPVSLDSESLEFSTGANKIPCVFPKCSKFTVLSLTPFILPIFSVYTVQGGPSILQIKFNFLILKSAYLRDAGGGGAHADRERTSGIERGASAVPDLGLGEGGDGHVRGGGRGRGRGVGQVGQRLDAHPVAAVSGQVKLDLSLLGLQHVVLGRVLETRLHLWGRKSNG